MSLMLALGLLKPLSAGEIRGVITVKRRLTKRVAAPSLDTYERGAAVPIAVKEEDPLVYERTDTVVYLEGELPATASVTKKMQQENRAFGPDLVVLPAGSSVSFPNLDPIFHNVFSLSRAKSFDLGNYSKGQTRTVTFPKPGIVLVNCRLHTNMSAVVVVPPNHFYASPDEQGRFAIPDVPPGRYTLTASSGNPGIIAPAKYHRRPCREPDTASSWKRRMVLGISTPNSRDFSMRTTSWPPSPRMSDMPNSNAL